MTGRIYGGKALLPGFLLAFGTSMALALDDLPLNRIELPEGFRIAVFAEGVTNARSMTLSPAGTLFVGTRTDGRVWAVRDEDGDFRADRIYTLAEGLRMPNGVAFRNGHLYVAEVSRVVRFDGIEDRLENPPRPTVLNDSFPTDRHHGWKFLAFGPDGKLYLNVGAPCNVCDPEDERYATIMQMNADGSGAEVFAHGVRQSVGFDWHPRTGDLWFTDNGRDWLGDDRPSDELNRAAGTGRHFGYPYCHQGDIPDPEFGATRPCSELTPPAMKLGPHVAAIGMRFYRGAMFPAAYRGQVLIAEHGSWNRSTPLGYRLTRVTVKGGEATGYEVFVQGWLQEGEAWGRPVDVQELPDGSLLVSDDRAGVIYRITYSADPD